MTSTTATSASPTPYQTEGTAESATVTGLTLAAVMLGIVLLTVVVGLVIRGQRRRPPAPPHRNRPFANP
ncbi:hypothetical protein [Longivirga aurantiaca]|uniref:Uncharacterized protein n=1 Tax=Longivirga aurantiaca TaxID=1837743 RepID=A0ABW1T2D5_9ACTN